MTALDSSIDDVPVGRELSPSRVIALLSGAVGAVILFSWVLSRLGLQAPALPINIGAKLATAAVALAVVDHLGWWRRVGFVSPVRWSRLWLAWLPLLYLLLVFSPGLPARGPVRVLGIAALSLAVGLDEETWMRGLLLESLRHRGTWYAVVASSAFFGLFHGINIVSGQPASTTAVQVFVAFSFGLALGGLRVRTHSLWPSILVHAAWDFALVLRSGEIGESSGTSLRDALLTIALMSPLAIYGLVLSRPGRTQGPDGRLRREPGPAAEDAAAPAPPAAPVALGPWPEPPPEVEAVFGGAG